MQATFSTDFKSEISPVTLQPLANILNAVLCLVARHLFWDFFKPCRSQ